jgi:hypothetical protein
MRTFYLWYGVPERCTYPAVVVEDGREVALLLCKNNVLRVSEHSEPFDVRPGADFAYRVDGTMNTWTNGPLTQCRFKAWAKKHGLTIKF